MRRKNIEAEKADILLSDILGVFTTKQVLRMVDEVRRLEGIGYGRLTLIIHNQQLTQIQTQESYDFRDVEE